MTVPQHQGERVNYAIIRFNNHTEESSTIAVVRGRSMAELKVDFHERRLNSSEREAGWGYFLEQTTDPPAQNKSAKSKYPIGKSRQLSRWHGR